MFISQKMKLNLNLILYKNQLKMCHRWKYEAQNYPGMISFWLDWMDLLEVQGTVKSLLQHHST